MSTLPAAASVNTLPGTTVSVFVSAGTDSMSDTAVSVNAMTSCVCERKHSRAENMPSSATCNGRVACSACARALVMMTDCSLSNTSTVTTSAGTPAARIITPSSCPTAAERDAGGSPPAPTDALTTGGALAASSSARAWRAAPAVDAASACVAAARGVAQRTPLRAPCAGVQADARSASAARSSAAAPRLMRAPAAWAPAPCARGGRRAVR
jgi:hypothetical protein